VGVRRTEIVLAEWTLAMDAPLRALVLRHEAEHVRGGDARLLAAAALLIAAMPWNAPLWWLAHRLRLALEVDCDARVLRAYPDVRRYGLLLLTVAQRAAAVSGPRAPLAPAALAESLTDLERRIDVMRAPTPTHRLPRTALRAAGAALAVAAFAFACATPEAVSGTRRQRPTQGVLELDSMLVTPTGASRRTPQPAPNTAATAATRGAPRVVSDSSVYFEFQVERPVTIVQTGVGPRYPDSLKTTRTEGEVLVQFVVDTTGLIQLTTFKVLKASHGLFVDAVRTALPDLRFEPALVGGRKVRQLVQQPFQFALSK
jgi:TonB family protein